MQTGEICRFSEVKSSTITDRPLPAPQRNISLNGISGDGPLTGKGKAFVNFSNAEPGSSLILMGAFSRVNFGDGDPITRGLCEGENLLVTNAFKITAATADANGTGTFNFSISRDMRGRTLYVEAYSQSKGTFCKLSFPSQRTIPNP